MEHTPPVTYPSVMIQGQALTLKCSLLAQYVLSRLGIDARQIPTLLGGMNPRSVATMVDLFSACVAHNFADQDPPQPIPSPDYWAARIAPDQWKTICDAVVEAMRKVQPAGVPAQALPAAESQAAAN